MAAMKAEDVRLRNCCSMTAVYVRSAGSLLLLLLIGSLVGVHPQGRDVPPVPSRPGRLVNIQGQVSLSNGRPAGVVVVKLTTRGGVPRETFTNDQGRFEFDDMEDGGYVLVARSPADPRLVSDTIQADTSQTATGSLNVSLTLHLVSEGSEDTKPGVLRVDERSQNIPKDARKAFNQGLKFKENNEDEKAFESFSRAIDLYPHYYQALTARGDAYIFQRKLNEARADFESALKINSHYAAARRGSGYCKLEQGEYEAAAQDLEQSISDDPGNASAHLLLGIADLALDRRDAAKAALTKALSFDPPAVRAHIYLANLYAKEHTYKQAADELHRYLVAAPRDPDRAKLESIEAQWRTLAPKQ